VGHHPRQFLSFGRIIDLGEFLREIQVIPADDAILDEPFAGFRHLLVFLLRLQGVLAYFDTGGPKGRKAQDGRIANKYPQLNPLFMVATANVALQS
jgi:hypothetical protein